MCVWVCALGRVRHRHAHTHTRAHARTHTHTHTPRVLAEAEKNYHLLDASRRNDVTTDVTTDVRGGVGGGDVKPKPLYGAAVGACCAAGVCVCVCARALSRAHVQAPC